MEMIFLSVLKSNELIRLAQNSVRNGNKLIIIMRERERVVKYCVD